MINKNVSDNKDHAQNIRKWIVIHAKININLHQVIKDVTLLIIDVLSNLRLLPFIKAKIKQIKKLAKVLEIMIKVNKNIIQLTNVNGPLLVRVKQMENTQ